MESTKRCRYCGETVLAVATICKHCRSNLGKEPQARTTLSWPFRVGLGFIVFTLVLVWLYSSPDQNAGNFAPSPTVPSVSPSVVDSVLPVPNNSAQAVVVARQVIRPKTLPKRPIYKTSAELLFRDYNSNEVKTDQLINGAIVEIDGIIQSIDKDILDDPEIKLIGGDRFDSVLLTLTKDQTNAAAKLEQGQHVTLRCEKMRRLINSPVGSDCFLLN